MPAVIRRSPRPRPGRRQVRPQHDDSHPQEVLARRRVRMALTDARRRHVPGRADQSRHQRVRRRSCRGASPARGGLLSLTGLRHPPCHSFTSVVLKEPAWHERRSTSREHLRAGLRRRRPGGEGQVLRSPPCCWEKPARSRARATPNWCLPERARGTLPLTPPASVETSYSGRNASAFLAVRFFVTMPFPTSSLPRADDPDSVVTAIAVRDDKHSTSNERRRRHRAASCSSSEIRLRSGRRVFRA